MQTDVGIVDVYACQGLYGICWNVVYCKFSGSSPEEEKTTVLSSCKNLFICYSRAMLRFLRFEIVFVFNKITTKSLVSV